MGDTARTVLIALGVALLVVVLVPALFMGGVMGSGVMGIGGMMGGQCCGGAPWLAVGLVLLVLVCGIALLVAGIGRPGGPHPEA